MVKNCDKAYWCSDMSNPSMSPYYFLPALLSWKTTFNMFLSLHQKQDINQNVIKMTSCIKNKKELASKQKIYDLQRYVK